MAKKKVVRKKKVSPLLGIANTRELQADESNPREIADKAAAGLRQSMVRFGDLSGIVFNLRTGELIAGHQRMKQIRDEYGDQEIELLDAVAELGIIRIDKEISFAVRAVDWDRKKQVAANVAANSQRISGKFDSTLPEYLLAVEAEITAEDPAMFSDLLLDELLLSAQAVASNQSEGTSDSSPDGEAGATVAGVVTFDVIARGASHVEQTEICVLLEREGHVWETVPR